MLIKEVMPEKSSRAAGQVFGPDRPHKSLHVLGRRLKTKVLVTGLEVSRRPDMPSKSVGGRKLAGGFDSRPPPLPKAPSDVRRSAEPARGGRGKGAQTGPTAPRPPHKSFVCPSAQHRTSLPTSRPRNGQVFSRRPLEGEEEAAWFALGRPIAIELDGVRMSGTGDVGYVTNDILRVRRWR